MPEFPKPPPAKPVRANNIRLSVELWERLKKIGALQEPPRSLNEVVAFFLEWACDDWDRIQKDKDRTQKGPGENGRKKL